MNNDESKPSTEEKSTEQRPELQLFNRHGLPCYFDFPNDGKHSHTICWGPTRSGMTALNNQQINS